MACKDCNCGRALLEQQNDEGCGPSLGEQMIEGLKDAVEAEAKNAYMKEHGITEIEGEYFDSKGNFIEAYDPIHPDFTIMEQHKQNPKLDVSSKEKYKEAANLIKQWQEDDYLDFVAPPPKTTMTFKLEGKKDDSEKVRIDLIPVEFIIGVGQAYTFGMKKYGEDNYRSGIKIRRIMAAGLRHFYLWLSGIDVDSESGLPHWAHVGACVGMAVFMLTHRPNMDDRYAYTDEEKKRIENMMYGEKK